MIRVRLSDFLRSVAVRLETLSLRTLGKKENPIAANYHRILVPMRGDRPQIEGGSWISPNSSLVGKVKVGGKTAIGWGTILRGDHAEVKVGDEAYIGDLVTISPLPDLDLKVHPISIGDHCSIGSGTVISGGSIGTACFIDIGCRLLPGVTMEDFSALGPGSVVLPGTHIKSGEYWVGNPAQHTATLSDEIEDSLPAASEYYRRLTSTIEESLKTGPPTVHGYPDQLRVHELYASPEESLKIHKML